MVKKLIQTAFQPHISLMVVKVYIPILFPLTFLIGMSAIVLDSTLGFSGGFIPEPHNYTAAVVTFIVGAGLWIWTYEQLARVGEGSPSPTAGRTLKLVDTGIYAYSRNPSLFGKVLGFFAVGLALNSITFCFILTPLLLTGSLVEKVWRQEPQLVKIFGKEYVEYRNKTPLFIPWTLLKRS